MTTTLSHNLFIAYNYEMVLMWCRQHDVNPNTIRYWTSPQDGRGLMDYNIVFVDDWYNNQDRDAIDRALRRAARIVYTADSIPVVYKGRIIDWKEKPNGPESLER